MNIIYQLINVSENDYSEIEDWMYECSITSDELIDFLREQIEELDRPIWDIELKILVFEYILMKADLSELVDCLEYDEEEKKVYIAMSENELQRNMEMVVEEDRNDAWLFLTEYFSILI